MKLARVLLMLGLGCLLVRALGAEGVLPPAGSPPSPDEVLFNGPMLHFVLTVPPQDLAILSENRGREAGQESAHGTVVVGSNIFNEVRLQLKGSGSFRGLGYRPSWTLKFKNSAPCFGLTKLHLNNSVHDPARLNEMLGGELHRQAGVPSPRATPVRVTFNGRDLGVYVLKEGFDQRFLARHFPDPSGNLYDPSWGEDINARLEIDSGPDRRPRPGGAVAGTAAEAPQTDREQLRAATLVPVEQRLAALSSRLDMDRFLTTMALQLLTDDWDGYVRHRNNFRLYHDPATDRMVFLPHGMDHLFSAPRSRLYWPEITGIVAAKLMAVPGISDRLRGRMEELGRTVFAETNVLALVDRTEARLLSGLAGRPEREREFYRNQGALLRERIRERIAWCRSEPPTSSKAPFAGTAILADWKPWAEVPDTDLEKRVRPDGQAVLFIAAHSPATCASWRTRLRLPAGNYRFEGEVATRGVRLVPEARDPGVGLRVVPARRGIGLSGTVGDTPMSHDFRVDHATEVVFVAELSGHAGSVEFLRDSLRVVRLADP